MRRLPDSVRSASEAIALAPCDFPSCNQHSIGCQRLRSKGGPTFCRFSLRGGDISKAGTNTLGSANQYPLAHYCLVLLIIRSSSELASRKTGSLNLTDPLFVWSNVRINLMLNCCMLIDPIYAKFQYISASQGRSWSHLGSDRVASLTFRNRYR